MAEEKKNTPSQVIPAEDDKPDYQEKITFLISTVAQGFILAWCLVVLSLGYIKLPNRLFGLDIPDQPRVDSTFAAGLLGNILAGMGVSVNAAQGAKKKKKEEKEDKVAQSDGMVQTIRVITPIKIEGAEVIDPPSSKK